MTSKAIAQLFGSEKNSDCVIVFTLNHDVIEPGAKRQRPTGETKEGGKGIEARETVLATLPAHTFILKLSSERLGAKIERWEEGPDSSGVRPELRVALGSEEEVPAARAAIAFAYTEAVQAASMLDVLMLRQQAAYLQIEGCVAGCDAWIKDKLATDVALASELYTHRELWPTSPEQLSFDADLLALARCALLRHFPNTLAVLNTPALRAQLLGMPAEGVQALLESDEFGTDSESSVLLLLATWMQANYAKTDAPTRENLCRLVRLTQLSRPYLGCILPGLALDYTLSMAKPRSRPTPSSYSGWIPIGSMEAAFANSVATAIEGERRELIEAGEEPYPVEGPSYSNKPRSQCVPCSGLSYDWSINQQDLERALSELEPAVEVKHVYGEFDGGMTHVTAHGFSWRPSLQLEHAANACPSAGLFLWCLLPNAYEVQESILMSRKQASPVVGMDAKVTVHRKQGHARKDVVVAFKSSRDTVVTGLGRGGDAVVILQQQAGGGADGGLLGPWREYLLDGKLTGTLSFLRPA